MDRDDNVGEKMAPRSDNGHAALSHTHMDGVVEGRGKDVAH